MSQFNDYSDIVRLIENDSDDRFDGFLEEKYIIY